LCPNGADCKTINCDVYRYHPRASGPNKQDEKSEKMEIDKERLEPMNIVDDTISKKKERKEFKASIEYANIADPIGLIIAWVETEVKHQEILDFAQKLGIHLNNHKQSTYWNKKKRTSILKIRNKSQTLPFKEALLQKGWTSTLMRHNTKNKSKLIKNFEYNSSIYTNIETISNLKYATIKLKSDYPFESFIDHYVNLIMGREDKLIIVLVSNHEKTLNQHQPLKFDILTRVTDIQSRNKIISNFLDFQNQKEKIIVTLPHKLNDIISQIKEKNFAMKVHFICIGEDRSPKFMKNDNLKEFQKIWKMIPIKKDVNSFCLMGSNLDLFAKIPLRTKINKFHRPNDQIPEQMFPFGNPNNEIENRFNIIKPITEEREFNFLDEFSHILKVEECMQVVISFRNKNDWFAILEEFQKVKSISVVDKKDLKILMFEFLNAKEKNDFKKKY